jgi:hypothetical protein
LEKILFLVINWVVVNLNELKQVQKLLAEDQIGVFFQANPPSKDLDS